MVITVRAYIINTLQISWDPSTIDQLCFPLLLQRHLNDRISRRPKMLGSPTRSHSPVCGIFCWNTGFVCVSKRVNCVSFGISKGCPFVTPGCPFVTPFFQGVPICNPIKTCGVLLWVDWNVSFPCHFGHSFWPGNKKTKFQFWLNLRGQDG